MVKCHVLISSNHSFISPTSGQCHISSVHPLRTRCCRTHTFRTCFRLDTFPILVGHDVGHFVVGHVYWDIQHDSLRIKANLDTPFDREMLNFIKVGSRPGQGCLSPFRVSHGTACSSTLYFHEAKANFECTIHIWLIYIATYGLGFGPDDYIVLYRSCSLAPSLTQILIHIQIPGHYGTIFRGISVPGSGTRVRVRQCK